MSHKTVWKGLMRQNLVPSSLSSEKLPPNGTALILILLKLYALPSNTFKLAQR